MDKILLTQVQLNNIGQENKFNSTKITHTNKLLWNYFKETMINMVINNYLLYASNNKK